MLYPRENPSKGRTARGDEFSLFPNGRKTRTSGWDGTADGSSVTTRPSFQPAKGANALWQPKGHPTTRLRQTGAARTGLSPAPEAEKDPSTLLVQRQLGKRRQDKRAFLAPAGSGLAACTRSRKGSFDVIGAAPPGQTPPGQKGVSGTRRQRARSLHQKPERILCP